MTLVDRLWVVPITGDDGDWKIDTVFRAPTAAEAQALCHEHMAQLYRMLPNARLNIGEAQSVDILGAGS